MPVPVPEAGGRALRCAGERLPARCRRRRACALRSGVGGCASAGSAASNQRAGCVRGGAGAGGQGRRAGNVVGSHLTAGAAVGPQPVPGAAELWGAGRAGGPELSSGRLACGGRH